MRQWLAIAVTMLALGVADTARATTVSLINVNGAIGPATATYISRAIDLATARDNQCLIILLDTPGGLVASMEDIVKSFYASKVPIVVFVAPSGGAATSAGTYITMAADIAAMAPNTRIGAAHPVSLTGLFGAESTNSVMGAKAENDLATFARNVAEKRGRNADWAESAVRESASITSEKALELHVIDLIAKDVPDLLKQIDGREVNGKELHTVNAAVTEISMSFREKTLNLLRPEVMFILLLMVIYGIIGELSNPGAILPGVVGAIAIVLFLYMTTVIPVNIAGLALILLAIGLFIADIFATTHGVLTAGGIISFFLGALMLFNRADPAFRLSLGLIIPATVVTALFFIFVVGAGLRAQFLPVRVGRETLIGRVTPAVARIDATGGKVFVEGEYWNAVSDAVIEKDQPAEIVAVNGLTLKVKPKTP